MKYVVSIVISLLVGLGLGYAVFHDGASNQPVGGTIRTTDSHFVSGFYAGSTDQFSVNSSGNVSTSGTVAVSGTTSFTGAVSATANRGTVVTSAAGTGTTTVPSGAVCVASATGATGTISTYASTSGTTLTVKGTPSQAFQFVCF